MGDINGLLHQGWCSLERVWGFRRVVGKGRGRQGKIISKHSSPGGRRVNFLNTLKIFTGGLNIPHKATSTHNTQHVQHKAFWHWGERKTSKRTTMVDHLH